MTIKILKMLYPKSKVEETKTGFRVYPNIKSCIDTSIYADYLEIKGPNGKIDFPIPSDDRDDLEARIRNVLLCDDAEVIISQEQLNEYIETLFKGLY